VSRQVSDSQNLRKDELVDRTRLQIELLDRFAVPEQSAFVVQSILLLCYA
jgi:hypothetical protein